VDVALRGVGV